MSEREQGSYWKSKRFFHSEDGWTTICRRRPPFVKTEFQPPVNRNSHQNRSEARVAERDRSIFIDNLPPFYESFLLKKLFIRLGKIIDSYVPTRRRSATGTRYRFICFDKVEEALKAVKSMDGVPLFGFKISVKKSYSGKKSLSNQTRNIRKPEAIKITNQKDKTSINGRTFAEVVSQNRKVWREKKEKDTIIYREEKVLTMNDEFYEEEMWSKFVKSKEWESFMVEQLELKKTVLILEERCSLMEAVMKGWSENVKKNEDKKSKYTEGVATGEEEEGSKKTYVEEENENISITMDEDSVVPESPMEEKMFCDNDGFCEEANDSDEMFDEEEGLQDRYNKYETVSNKCI